ncbi:hypothetical protein Sgly_0772 [Syntrophobotulus glycolicus DSM 8271]|uniref:Uncharacterized protein n=1 Tax=Syntrophobotulus glycolicus (strain DSM 8271 / FlGlyR) TaxID=645991 RepID=F0T165_SYNGF|nr:major capsid protein [Syntrophobotulus glycolicus]ADY55129.1 hypothetical protein Sgly_0772 [Syntrophobotulus glycolicus DSM 8271]
MPEDIQSLDGTVLTELAQTFENHKTTIRTFFPVREVPESKVTVERVYSGAGMAPPVEKGQPDPLGDGDRQVDSQTYEPVYSRESFPVPTEKLNNLRMPGTLNEKYGRQYIADETKRYVSRSDLLFDFLGTQMFQGQVNYTDPRTKKTVNISAGIPSAHVITTVPTKPWTDPDATIIDDIDEMKKLIRNNGKVPATHIFMTTDMCSIMARNKQVISRAESARDTGFVVFKDGDLIKICGLEIILQDTVYEALALATAPSGTIKVNTPSPAAGTAVELTIGGVSSGTYTAVDGDTATKVAANLCNFINSNPVMPVTATVSGTTITVKPKNERLNQEIEFSSTGDIVIQITGSPLEVTGSGLVKTVTKMIPDHKVVICCKEFAGETVGRTDFVIGEHPEGKPGIWSRAANSIPPAAPGVIVQIGRAGAPYLLHPDWVVVRTVYTPG